MPTGWADEFAELLFPELLGSWACGFDAALATTKITYWPCTCPTTATAGKEAAHVALKQVQGVLALKGG